MSFQERSRRVDRWFEEQTARIDEQLTDEQREARRANEATYHMYEALFALLVLIGTMIWLSR